MDDKTALTKAVETLASKLDDHSRVMECIVAVTIIDLRNSIEELREEIAKLKGKSSR